MSKKNDKQTLTYYGSKKIKEKALKRAEKVGESLSEVIDLFLSSYATLPINKYVHSGQPVKTSFEDVQGMTRI